MYIKNSSGWKQINEMYIKVASGWKKINEGYIKTAAGWKRFWSGGTLAPQNPVTISQSTNATTYLITLTGTNYSWTPGPPSLTYYFEWSTNGGTTWTTLSSGTAVNPSYGSSTQYTHQVTTSQFAADIVNIYRFRVYATYGSQTANSSATTNAQGPTNITLTAGTATVNSVPLSWTASTGAGRYMIYYGTTSSPSTLYAGTSSLSSTVSGLSPNQLYYFKVVPITGLTNNTGYTGNDSNIVNATTLADLTNTAIPTISGTLTEGQTITMSNGSWNLTPDSYAYQWLYYNGDPGSGYQGYVAIAGATSSSYTIPTNYRDVYGQYIRARVTASKSGYTTTSAYSNAQTVAYDATLPDPPTGLTVSDVGTNRPYNNAAYSLSWTAPSNTGGVALSGYKIQFQVPSTGGTWYDWSANAVDTTSTSITLSGFGSNLGTNFRIYSVNSVGQSASAVSTSSPVLGTTVPQAPTIGSAVLDAAYNGTIIVTYTAPTGNGGKTITSYTATSSPGSLTGTASSGSISVSSLTHNTQYTFTVTATNANGTSVASSATSSIYAVNIGKPTIDNVTSGYTTLVASFTAGTNSDGTRAYLNNSLDGTATSPYTFSGLTHNTTYTLGFAGTATVNGTLYVGQRTSGSYVTLTGTAPSISSVSVSPTTGTAGTTTYTATVTATGTPAPTYTYQWKYLDQGSTYLNISGATSSTYSPPSNFFTLGYASPIKCSVTATNVAGSASADSNTASVSNPFVTPAPTVPPSFIFSRGLNGATSTTRRNWGWNVSSGIGSYSYVIYELYFYEQTTQPASSATPTTILTFGSSSASAPVSNANTYNLSGTSTPNYRTMARGSSYGGSNGNTITASSSVSWGKARCRVTATNGVTYDSSFTAYA